MENSINNKNNANKDNYKIYVKTAVVLALIASMTALMLAVVNGFTSERIKENFRLETNNAISELFADGKTFEKLDTEFKLPITEVWSVGGDEGHNLGYCLFVEVKGFKEEIVFVVGADTTGRCIGVKVLTSAETAGLGSLIIESDYLSQYIGKYKDLTLNNDIDAVTGATISSRALLEGVNAALAADIFEPATTREETTAAQEAGDTEGGIFDEQVTD